MAAAKVKCDVLRGFSGPRVDGKNGPIAITEKGKPADILKSTYELVKDIKPPVVKLVK